MRGHCLRLGFLLLCLAALATTLAYRFYAGSLAEQQEAWKILQPEPRQEQAPGFSLSGIDGARVELEALRGRSVLLNFWATWCEPCKQELPHLASLAAGLGDSDPLLLLVSVDESWTPVRDLARRLEEAGGHGREAAGLLRGLPGASLSALDPQESAARAYGTSRYPETYLIGPDGRLHYRFVGPKPWGQEGIRAWLSEMSRRLR